MMDHVIADNPVFITLPKSGVFEQPTSMTLPRNYHSSEFSSDEAASTDEAPHFGTAGGDSNMGRYSDEEEQVRADACVK